MKFSLLSKIFTFTFFFTSILHSDEGTHIETFRGEEIIPYIKDITNLCLNVYCFQLNPGILGCFKAPGLKNPIEGDIDLILPSMRFIQSRGFQASRKFPGFNWKQYI